MTIAQQKNKQMGMAQMKDGGKCAVAVQPNEQIRGE